MCWLNSFKIIKVHDATDKIHVKYVAVVGSLMYKKVISVLYPTECITSKKKNILNINFVRDIDLYKQLWKTTQGPEINRPLIEIVWPRACLTSDRIEIMNFQLVPWILIQITLPVYRVLNLFSLQMQADVLENPQQTIIFSFLILFDVVHYRST